jgi:hypothetical protein
MILFGSARRQKGAAGSFAGVRSKFKSKWMEMGMGGIVDAGGGDLEA